MIQHGMGDAHGLDSPWRADLAFQSAIQIVLQMVLLVMQVFKRSIQHFDILSEICKALALQLFLPSFFVYSICDFAGIRKQLSERVPFA